MDQQIWTHIMCRMAFGPLQRVHHPAGGGSFWILYACCRSKYSKFDGKTCCRSLYIADSIKISFASSILFLEMSQRGEFGIHLWEKNGQKLLSKCYILEFVLIFLFDSFKPPQNDKNQSWARDCHIQMCPTFHQMSQKRQ